MLLFLLAWVKKKSNNIDRIPSDTSLYKYATYSFETLVMKICACKLTSAIYCIAWSFFLLQLAKAFNSQVTEWVVCTWVMSKLTYWYICDICSMASRVKGYKALPLLTFCRRCVGGESGNEAEKYWPRAIEICVFVSSCTPSNCFMLPHPHHTPLQRKEMREECRCVWIGCFWRQRRREWSKRTGNVSKPSRLQQVWSFEIP